MDLSMTDFQVKTPLFLYVDGSFCLHVKVSSCGICVVACGTCLGTGLVTSTVFVDFLLNL